MPAASGFLNVDLEIAAERPMSALDAALEPHATQLFIGKIDRLHHAHYETDKLTKTADATIRELIKALRRLRGEALAEWSGATRRVFDVGLEVHAGAEPLLLTISADTIAQIVSVGGSISITGYSSGRSRVRRRRARARPQ